MGQVNNFKAAAIGQEFKDACLQLDGLLSELSQEEALELRTKLRHSVEEYKQQGGLNIAFVGQYSAGKSTIISALTGRRDIKIDTDIATDTTTSYPWNGVHLVDTPGLFTDRLDHDETTYSAIERSDLLVFCLTHMLFDSITVDNFKKLAYDKGYGWKMMLVVNKMSAEAGEDAKKIAAYRKSLEEALAPHQLSDFPICFIDAKDYCDGVDEDDDFLKEISRFDTFVSALNTFVSQKNSYAKLDTPIRILLGVVDNAETLLLPRDTENAMFLEILTCLSRRTEQERDRLRNRVLSLRLNAEGVIRKERDIVLQSFGEQEFQGVYARAEVGLNGQFMACEKDLERLFERALESIRQEVEHELEKPLPQAFVAKLTSDYESKEYEFGSRFDTESTKRNIGSLKKIAEGAGASFNGYAARGVFETAREGMALRSIDVVGSSLHGQVKAAGKLLGYKFKPWEAVKISKNIGNAARFLGPAMALAGCVAEGYALYKDRKDEQEQKEVYREIHKQFQDVAVSFKLQIEESLHEFEQQVYDDIQATIRQERRNRELVMDTADSRYKALISIRGQLDSALSRIQALAEVTTQK